jgi:hypothetical protein
MPASIQALAGAAQQIPAYCTSGTGIHTPQQWQTCWKLGWQQPTTDAANAGAFTGHNVAPGVILVAMLIVAALVLLSRRGKTATN